MPIVHPFFSDQNIMDVIFNFHNVSLDFTGSTPGVRHFLLVQSQIHIYQLQPIRTKVMVYHDIHITYIYICIYIYMYHDVYLVIYYIIYIHIIYDYVYDKFS